MRSVDQDRHRLLLLLPFAVMASVALADLVAGPQVGLLALFSLGPGFAAVAGSPRRAVLVDVLAWCCALRRRRTTVWTERAGRPQACSP